MRFIHRQRVYVERAQKSRKIQTKMKCILDTEADCLLESVHNLDRGHVCMACQVRQQSIAVGDWHACLLSNLAIATALFDSVNAIRDELKRLSKQG